MNAGAGLPSPDSALSMLLERLRPVGTERIALREAAGRVLAEPVAADRPSPALDVSAMDGYAVDLAGVAPGRVRIAVESAIGRPPVDLPPGVAARIVTGAPIPRGANAVVRREDVTEGEGWIGLDADLLGRVRDWENVRRVGENAGRGQAVAPPGRAVTPALAGALAAFGIAEPIVHRRVRVAVVATGDEVVAPDEPAEPWQLRDSNSTSLLALLSAAPWIEVVSAGRCADEPEHLNRAFDEALEHADALLASGGVSMGHRDFVPGVLRSLGVETLFHRVAQRPGKPLLAGIGPRGQAVLALPGNPVSVLVTARRFGAPALARLSGLERAGGPDGLVTLDDAPERPIALWLHRLVRLSAPGRAVRIETKGSGDVAGAARSDGFVEIPPGESGPGPWPFYAWDIEGGTP